MNFRNIGLFALKDDPRVTKTIRKLRAHLEQSGRRVWPESEPCFDLSAANFATTAERIQNEIELGIAIGGDGTMLHLARNFSTYNIPLVGVNLGRLGFLTDISADNMQLEIDEILAGEYYSENRLLLSASLPHGDGVPHTDIALNDIVVAKGGSGRLIEYELRVNDDYVGTTRGDGVIISTPTGSTAYALSAGGPILHPTLPAINVVPLSPHTLSHRPIVLTDDSIIFLKITETAGANAEVFLDGSLWHTLAPDDKIIISRSQGQANLIRACSHNHFSALRSKLGWAG
ncbi:MAG: NAD+ kinase [Parasphingorhabdus sp.]|jgi:NAD+ kinase